MTDVPTGEPPEIARLVPIEMAGERLDVFLARQPEVGSRARARFLIEGGHVKVPGARVRPGLFLEAGHEVLFRQVDPPVQDRLAGDGTEPPDMPVLYADDAIAVVDKPAGISSHPPEDRDFRGHTVAGIARTLFGDLPALSGPDRPGIVHRLDRETSGVMVLARTESAFHALRAQFKNREVEKEYRCICYGEARFLSDHIERAIAPDPRRPDRMTVVEEGGRASNTYYEVLERFSGFTYFRCMPKTGRTHQIRVHLTSIGHSLIGDKTYRSRRAQHRSLPEGAPDPGRQCLHAFRIAFRHPMTQDRVEFEAPLPEDMEALLAFLRTACRA
ncbi:MAG: 23S rRNA pseudouridine(1911/1915/1917) synthase RluD [Planctomycetota bacterium]